MSYQDQDLRSSNGCRHSVHSRPRFRRRIRHGQGRLRPCGLGGSRRERRVDQRCRQQSDGYHCKSRKQTVLRPSRKVGSPTPFAELVADCISSYKFHRLFPLSQYDLPTHNPGTLAFPQSAQRPVGELGARPSIYASNKSMPSPSIERSSVPTSLLPAGTIERTMTADQISKNPDVDYTR